jgi:hypothetical protein
MAFGLIGAILAGLGHPNGEFGGFILGWVFGLFVSHSVGSAITAQFTARELRVPSVLPWIGMYLPVVLAPELLFGWYLS